MSLAPIVLFVYGRPQHTRQTLEALLKNELASQSVLYIFADGAKPNASPEQLEKIRETRAIIREKQWCGTVHIAESGENKGLADSIIAGVTRIVNEYGKIIVLEDDIVTSPAFLSYMNNALTLYENDNQVMNVNGYVLPIKSDKQEKDNTFFTNLMLCWGWGTWKRAWDFYSRDVQAVHNKLVSTNSVREFDYNNSGYLYGQIKGNIDGKVKTWAVFWQAAIFFNKGLCLTPRTTFVQNIGADSTGEHEGTTDIYIHKEPLAIDAAIRKIPVKKDRQMEKKVEFFYKYYRNVSAKEQLKIQIMDLLKSIYTHKYVFDYVSPVIKTAKRIIKK